MKREDDLKLKLFTLQDDILIQLANAQGNVLENKVNIHEKRHVVDWTVGHIRMFRESQT